MVAVETQPGLGPPLREPRAWPPAVVRPSDLAREGRLGEPVRIGGRSPLSGEPDMEALGQAVHGFLAADRPEWTAERRVEVARGLLKLWGVASAVPVEALVGMGAALRAWAETHAPGAVWRREWPLMQRLAGGTLLKGMADLVLKTADALYLVDHKSFPGALPEALERAAGHAGQLAAYASALTEATGKPVKGAFIHLPITGVVVPVSWQEATGREAAA